MPGDKYSAVWVSHSSMGDFLKCPRAYFLHNVYKSPKTGNKMALVNPHLSLGLAVHEALENLKKIRVEERLQRNLFDDYDGAWKKISGKRGGFRTQSEEDEAKERGRKMIERVVQNPGPLARKTVNLKEAHNGMPPNFFLSEEHNIILCGLIDWLEYVEADDSIKVIDFKTGKREESEGSLQLPIYLLLLNQLQKRKVSGAGYWYLEFSDEVQDVALPDAETARAQVLAVALQVKEARMKKEFVCPRGAAGCFACQPFEAILKGEGELVGSMNRQDLYLV